MDVAKNVIEYIAKLLLSYDQIDICDLIIVIEFILDSLKSISYVEGHYEILDQWVANIWKFLTFLTNPIEFIPAGIR